MKFIQKHKTTFIILAIFLILMVFAFIGVKELLYPNLRKSLYGSRLDGIEQFNVNEDRLNKVKDKLLKEEAIEKVNSNLTGRIVKFFIYIKGDLDLITSHSFADKILEEFNAEEQKYFDFEVYIVSDVKDSEYYPIVGYKHKTSTTFKWTN